MNEPLIDVIIPVFNCERFIADAIASVQMQNHKELNIIIINDGSEDNTVSVVLELMRKDERIKFLQQPHKGISAALNNGINNSAAPFIAFLDADDVWHAEKLEKQLKCIIENDLQVCFCLLQEFETAPIKGIAASRARLNPMKGYSKTAFLGRRDVFNKYGLFDETIAIGDFIEWFGRMIRVGISFTVIEEVLAYRRVHDANTTGNVDKNSYLKLLKAHLDEIRKTNKT